MDSATPIGDRIRSLLALLAAAEKLDETVYYGAQDRLHAAREELDASDELRGYILVAAWPRHCEILAHCQATDTLTARSELGATQFYDDVGPDIYYLRCPLIYDAEQDGYGQRVTLLSDLKTPAPIIPHNPWNV